MPPQDSEQYDWFMEYLHPHERQLRVWLRSQFPSSLDVDAVVQESYLRILTARKTQVIATPKAFLFATARNLALMQVRHRRVERIDPTPEADVAAVIDESPGIPDALVRAHDFESLTKAVQSLPDRCRQIITLRKIYGLSQREVAHQLGITEHTVEAQSTIGLRRLVEYFDRISE